MGSVSRGQAQAVLGGDGHPRRGQAALFHLAQAVGASGALQEHYIFTRMLWPCSPSLFLALALTAMELDPSALGSTTQLDSSRMLSLLHLPSF